MKPSPLIETRISTLDGNSIANDEAANFATTRFKQFLPWVCLYRRTFRFKAWRLELGDVVNLTDTDNAIDAVRAQVISRSTDHDKEQVELILAYRQPAYVPSPREAILLTFAEIEIPA